MNRVIRSHHLHVQKRGRPLRDAKVLPMLCGVLRRRFGGEGAGRLDVVEPARHRRVLARDLVVLAPLIDGHRGAVGRYAEGPCLLCVWDVWVRWGA